MALSRKKNYLHPQKFKDIEATQEWARQHYMEHTDESSVRLADFDFRKLYGVLSGSDTWDPASIADGDEEAKEVTVTGAALGDFVIASFSLDVTDLTLTANVTAASTVTCVLANNTGGAIDLASGTIYVRVIQRT
jgi:hypothetical protein